MDFSRLDAVMEDMVNRGVPGCELAVSYKGETVYRKSVGFADHGRTRPASADDIYWIYSCSKVITCVAAMRLVESGVIKLDDPVSKYIPEFASLSIKDKKTGVISPATKVMTVQHLFTMTGGMDYNFKAEAIAAAIYCAVGAFAFSYYFSKNEEMKGVTLISVLCSIGLYGLIMLIDFMIWGRTVAYYERPKSPKQGYDRTRNR
jgi:CubicO group peptidase (beta-lactamase class C family)